MARKDNRGRNLKTGESQRKDNDHPEMSIYDVMKEVSSIIQRNQPGLNMESIFQYDQAKEKLFMRVSSAEKNQELLQNVPYELKEDLAITFHFKFHIRHFHTDNVLIEIFFRFFLSRHTPPFLSKHTFSTEWNHENSAVVPSAIVS